MERRGDPTKRGMARALAGTAGAILMGATWAGVALHVPLFSGEGAGGFEAYVRGDYAEALAELRPLAEQGDAAAQYTLGLMFANGQAVTHDDAQAVRWYRRAAEQGHASAQRNLGIMYSTGRGVAQDAAEGVRWYREAALQGRADAQRRLALMYLSGKGVPRDDAEAVRWFRKASEQGDEYAQYRLGVSYAEGRGVAKDPVRALKWLNVAASRYAGSDPEAHGRVARKRDLLAQAMTPEQVERARELARERFRQWGSGDPS